MNEKHYLGELCDLGHEYENTGQSLRYESDGSCIECRNLALKLRREERKAKNEGKYYLGELCVAGHKHEGQNNSLRYVSSNHCVECTKLHDKKSYDARRDKILEQKKQYHINNKEKLSNKNKEYYQKNKDKIIQKNKEYYDEHKIHLNKKDWERKKQRINEDPLYKLNCRMSNAITKALKVKNTSKNGLSYLDYVDFTIEELKEHLEKQFTEGMSWENYGKWHVDHIVAKAHFDYQLPTDASFKECWSLKNFQPLWGTDNLSKGTKSMEEFIESKNELNIEIKMKKSEILKNYRLTKLDENTVFISNPHFEFAFTKPSSIVKEEYLDSCRYFGGLQSNYNNESPEYKNLENWLCEIAEFTLGIKTDKK